MIRYILHRCGHALLTIVLVLLLVFLIVRVIGDPSHLMLSPEATEADREVFRNQLGLDRPVAVQFIGYLADVLRGNWGYSYRFSQPALDVVAVTVVPTLVLALTALAVSIAVGVLLGVASAVRPDSWIDQAGKLFAVIGQAAPPFFIGLLLVKFFAIELPWLPTGGYGGTAHLILPAITLGWYGAAGVARLTRSSMLSVLQAEYIRFARIKGLSPSAIIFSHALRNALLPVMTIISLQLGVMLGGAVSIEVIFAWPGAGRLMLESIYNLDYTVVQAAALVTAFTFCTINLAVDILYAWVDPRIRYD